MNDANIILDFCNRVPQTMKEIFHIRYALIISHDDTIPYCFIAHTHVSHSLVNSNSNRRRNKERKKREGEDEDDAPVEGDGRSRLHIIHTKPLA